MQIRDAHKEKFLERAPDDVRQIQRALYDAYPTVQSPSQMCIRAIRPRKQNKHSNTTCSHSSEDSTPQRERFSNMEIKCSSEQPNTVRTVNITLDIDRIPTDPTDKGYPDQMRLLQEHIAGILHPVQKAIIRCPKCNQPFLAQIKYCPNCSIPTERLRDQSSNDMSTTTSANATTQEIYQQIGICIPEPPSTVHSTSTRRQNKKRLHLLRQLSLLTIESMTLNLL